MGSDNANTITNQGTKVCLIASLSDIISINVFFVCMCFLLFYQSIKMVMFDVKRKSINYDW